MYREVEEMDVLGKNNIDQKSAQSFFKSTYIAFNDNKNIFLTTYIDNHLGSKKRARFMELD